MSTANSTALQATAKATSTSTFLTSLWVNSAVFAGEVLAFTILCKIFIDVYQPRTSSFWPKRAPHLGRFWLLDILRINDDKVFELNGLDAYMFVRFLRMMVVIFIPIWIVSWFILLPVDAVHSGTSNTGLDRFTFGNIPQGEQSRYWTHLVCAWLFTIWIWFVIRREMRFFVGKRQGYLISKEHRYTPQARTILITGIPQKDLTDVRLKAFFSYFPGGVKYTWLNRDLKSLPDVYDERMAACTDLEKMETKLIHTAIQLNAKKAKDAEKQEKKEAKSKPKHTETEESGPPLSDSSRGRELSDSMDLTFNEASRPSGSAELSDTTAFSDPISGHDTTDGAKLTDSSYPKSRDFADETDLESGRRPVALAEKLVPDEKRPKKSLPLGPLPFAIPFLSKKVDGITWCREKIQETTKILEREQKRLRDEVGNEHTRVGGATGALQWGAKHIEARAKRIRGKGKKGRKGTVDEEHKAQLKLEKEYTYPALNSAFIMFNKQIAAHLAAQALAHQKPLAMSQRYIEVAPGDVIWGNLGLATGETRIRMVISYAATIGLIILWSIPVAFIGAISNISKLCTTYSWLAWLCNISGTAVGFIQGILPTVLLSVLMMLLPIVLRLLGRFEGIPTKSGLELSLMTRYFCFQVIHSFLIVTLSSGLIAALPGLVKDPTSIPSLLASSLPQASTFFLTYTILQGLSGTASGFLQIITFIMYYVKRILFGVTPRSLYTLGSVNWGTTFPATTLIAVIAIAYMVISPIINGLAMASFVLFYYLYRYLFVWSLEQPKDMETGGLFFPRAISHLCVGMYIQQICLGTLFFLARDSDNKASAIPQGALMIVLIAFTAFFNINLVSSYGPLIKNLPLSVAYEADERERKEKEAKERRGHKSSNDLSRIDTQSSVNTYSTHSTHLTHRTHSRPATPTGAEAGPSFSPSSDHPTRNEKDQDKDAEDEYSNYYYHPARSAPQRTIWIPRDGLGLGESERDACLDAGIDASTRNADMDGMGKVSVSGGPPGRDVQEEETS